MKSRRKYAFFVRLTTANGKNSLTCSLNRQRSGTRLICIATYPRRVRNYHPRESCEIACSMISYGGNTNTGGDAKAAMAAKRIRHMKLYE